MIDNINILVGLAGIVMALFVGIAIGIRKGVRDERRSKAELWKPWQQCNGAKERKFCPDTVAANTQWEFQPKELS